MQSTLSGISSFKQCVLSCDLKWGNESIFLSWGGSEFQRRGAERLNALLPMVVRRAEGTDRCMEEEDLREREVMGHWRRLDKYGEVMDGLECKLEDF